MSRYAELVFNLPVRGTFTYSLAPDSTAAVGCRVSAPFGARKLTGHGRRGARDAARRVLR